MVPDKSIDGSEACVSSVIVCNQYIILYPLEIKSLSDIPLTLLYSGWFLRALVCDVGMFLSCKMAEPLEMRLTVVPGEVGTVYTLCEQVAHDLE